MITSSGSIPRKHPHARGEDVPSPQSTIILSETPPRTWGRPSNSFVEDPRRRNTPTHVGKTVTAYDFLKNEEKHPHARGEDNGNLIIEPGHPETPPRTWGRPCASPLPSGRQGNTPTHVGKTRKSSLSEKPPGKHPHARGEDTSWSTSATQKSETPPRTWGRPVRNKSFFNDKGNTPTHVGKTMWLNFRKASTEKHPHARGEDFP